MRKGKKTGKTKKTVVAGAAFVLCVAALSFVFLNEGKSAPHRNGIDAKISVYSDKHITPNATLTNPEFKNIAFEAPPPSRSPIFSSQIAAVVRSIKYFIKTSPKAEPKEYGSWIWTPIMQMTPEYMESILENAQAQRVNVMYLSLDSYLDIFVMPKDAEREKQKEEFSKKVEEFLVRAKAKNISVDAEGGWQNWAEKDNTYKAFAVVNYVKNFNDTHQNKFRGFQYDVEPYLLDSYQEDKEGVLKNFVRLVDYTEHFLGESDLRFSVVVPDFYDEKDEMTPKFSYNGGKMSTFKHLLQILDRREDSSIIVMSYRNFADGFDGAIEVSQNEMRTAGRGAYDTKVVIAQETGDFPPPYITFYNMSRRHFNNQIGRINDEFDEHPNFGGIAVHYVNAFLALK